jgi:hypothetical protein
MSPHRNCVLQCPRTSAPEAPSCASDTGSHGRRREYFGRCVRKRGLAPTFHGVPGDARPFLS